MAFGLPPLYATPLTSSIGLLTVITVTLIRISIDMYRREIERERWRWLVASMTATWADLAEA
jgi:hypothetical protein